MMLKEKQRPTLVTAGYSWHESQWVKLQHKFQFKLPSGLNSLTKPLANVLISCINSSDFPPEDDTSTEGRTADELAVSIEARRLEKIAP